MVSAYFSRLAVIAVAGVVLAGCGKSVETPKHLRSLSYATLTKMEEQGLDKGDPILIRIYKQESELEVWKKSDRTGRYQLFKTYDICKWSGALGPKQKEGDRQAPEGFYTITPAQMNPNSSYWLSFNLGYPNAYDRSFGRTGRHLMVHGACSSAGCYSMNDEQIQEIYSLARDAFAGGQKAFQVQAFPFRMTPENLAKHHDNPNMPFWMNLKEGADHFEVAKLEPKVDVCGRRYVFNATPADNMSRFDPSALCPAYETPQALATVVAAKQQTDMAKTQVLIAAMENQGAPALQGAPAATMVASAGQAPQSFAAASGPATAGEATASPMPVAVPVQAAALPGAIPAAYTARQGSEQNGVRSFFSRLVRGAPEARPAPAPKPFEKQALNDILPPVISGAQPILPLSWTAFAPRR